MLDEHRFDRRNFLRTSLRGSVSAWMLGSIFEHRTGYARAAGSSGSTAGLSLARFRELHAELAPEDSEPLQSIPWKVATNEARKLAADRKQPLFMLSRSGHPLGCT